ncbi:MAG: metal-dependent transcriptional regulator [Peptococcaceae bacterium]|jgi:DtxR family Mn-dependent transcriptional regulator|nr:metal-dependent transcriptional regulator [Peptococcaceae bacterium]
MPNDIYESGEDYLETILRLQKQMEQVRSIDVAHALDYSKPSVSRAMKILSEKGLIYMDGKKYIHLTDLGLAKAENVARRHRLIQAALIEIFGVAPDVAEEDACRIEHIVSEETIEKIAAKLNEK